MSRAGRWCRDPDPAAGLDQQQQHEKSPARASIAWPRCGGAKIAQAAIMKNAANRRWKFELNTLYISGDHPLIESTRNHVP